MIKLIIQRGCRLKVQCLRSLYLCLIKRDKDVKCCNAEIGLFQDHSPLFSGKFHPVVTVAGFTSYPPWNFFNFYACCFLFVVISWELNHTYLDKIAATVTPFLLYTSGPASFSRVASVWARPSHFTRESNHYRAIFSLSHSLKITMSRGFSFWIVPLFFNRNWKQFRGCIWIRMRRSSAGVMALGPEIMGPLIICTGQTINWASEFSETPLPLWSISPHSQSWH